MTDLDPKAWINLERASVLLLDDTIEGIGILVQIASAFGVRTFHRCNSAEAAREICATIEIDLIIANANLKEESGYDFSEWLRRSKLEPNAFTPIILVTGHTQIGNIRKARDCGANFIVAKPLSPSVLLERITWVARERRPFVACQGYVGPDRRFHDMGPPEGEKGRRHDDVELVAEPDSAGADNEAPDQVFTEPKRAAR